MFRASLLVLVIALSVAPLAHAQWGQGGGGDEPALDVLSARTTRRITLVDNLYFGISGLDELRDYFEARGWEVEYAEDTYQRELFKLAQRTDILYIVTHAGVRQSDQQVGFVWRTLMGFNKNIVTADVVARELEGKPHPALVVVAGCQTTQNDSMARAFGGAYIGFSNTVNPASAATWCRNVLQKIADGKTYREAFRSTPPITSMINFEGGAPKLIEPATEE